MFFLENEHVYLDVIVFGLKELIIHTRTALEKINLMLEVMKIRLQRYLN